LLSLNVDQHSAPCSWTPFTQSDINSNLC